MYQISPNNLINEFIWVKKLIFKEVSSSSGTRQICNHIACKITKDILVHAKHKNLNELINSGDIQTNCYLYTTLCKYKQVSASNINSKITILYLIYLYIIDSKTLILNSIIDMQIKIFERLFSETSLHLDMDYRDLWLLENSICILIEYYLDSFTEFII